MRKFIICVLVFSFMALPLQKAQAMDAKGKAFLVICTYGTVGGALLGFATLAFGANSRAIAQGASLGLYAGIGFGAYVLYTHKKMGEAPADYEEDPYADPNGYPPGDGYGDPGAPVQDGGGFGAPPPQAEEPGGFFGGQRTLEISDKFYNYKFKHKKSGKFSPPVYINLLQMNF